MSILAASAILVASTRVVVVVGKVDNFRKLKHDEELSRRIYERTLSESSAVSQTQPLSDDFSAFDSNAFVQRLVLLAAADTLVRQQRKQLEESLQLQQSQLQPQPQLAFLPSPSPTDHTALSESPYVGSSPSSFASPLISGGYNVASDLINTSLHSCDEFTPETLLESLFDFNASESQGAQLLPAESSPSMDFSAPSEYSNIFCEATLGEEFGFPFDLPSEVAQLEASLEPIISSGHVLSPEVPVAQQPLSEAHMSLFSDMDLDMLLSSLGLPSSLAAAPPTPESAPRASPELVYFKEEPVDDMSSLCPPSPSSDGVFDQCGLAAPGKAPKQPRRRRQASSDPDEGAIIMPGYARNRGTAPKRYQCHLCGHLFSRRYNLVTHARVHENARDRPYVCSEPGCGATFYRPPDLLRHATVHSKEKPYQCQDCQKWFTRKDALKRHILVKGCQAPTEGL